MDPKLRAIVDSATRENLETLLLRDLLLSSLRIEAVPGVDVTQWGPNTAGSRSERDRQKQRMLAELRAAAARGEVTPEQAEEFGRLIRRLLR